MRFWLEWDCGTLNVRALAVKFTSFAHAPCGNGQESARCCQCSSVLYRISREARRMRRVAQINLTSTPGFVL